ncbi:hypothetical protein RB594_002015 [Gaeumannomyces avenae]
METAPGYRSTSKRDEDPKRGPVPVPMPAHGLTLPTPLKSPAQAFQRDPVEALRDLQSDAEADTPGGPAHPDDDDADDDSIAGASHSADGQLAAEVAAAAQAAHDSLADDSDDIKHGNHVSDGVVDPAAAAAAAAAAVAAAAVGAAPDPGQQPKPRFRYDAEKLLLSGPETLDSWLAQTEAIATATNCYAELTQQFNVATFPPDGTVMALICSARFNTAWRILEETISGPVWAMMRVYNLQGHYKSHLLPYDLYNFARWAAGRMHLAGTEEQPQDERMAMITEQSIANQNFYPSPKCYTDGCTWLSDKLHELIRLGDWRVAAAMYDPLPDWAPRPPAGVESTQGSPSTDSQNLGQPQQEHDQQQQQPQQQVHQQSNGKFEYASQYPPLPGGQTDAQPSAVTTSYGYAAPTETYPRPPGPSEESPKVEAPGRVDDNPPPTKRRRGRPSKYA